MLEERLLQSFLYENYQQQSCMAFIGLSICVKMIGGGRPLLHENLVYAYPPLSKTPIFSLFSLLVPRS